MAFWDDDTYELTDDEKEAVDRFLSSYNSVEEDDDERYARHWEQLTGRETSTSTAVVPYSTPAKKEAEAPLDPDLTREDVLESLALIDESYGHIDAAVREKFPKSRDQQAKEAKRLAEGYDKLKRQYERLLDRIEDRDKAALREQGVRDYDMFSVEGNRAVTEAMDALLSDIDTAQWALKDRVAESLREKLNEIGATYPEVFDTAVREAVFNDLVVSGLIQAFEPLDF